MRGLIVGKGEVGRALFNVLSPIYDTSICDKEGSKEAFDIVHISFPYSEYFVEEVSKYKKLGTYTVIHSTVPVGTTRKLDAVHSPIRGIHPKLDEGIRKFVKFIGGRESSKVADYFRRADIKVMLFDNPETTEAMKLFDTEYYRACIEFTHRVKKYCDKHGLSFHDVYTLANMTYNKGYKDLGHPEYIRPVLQPIMGKIGGHCVVPNSKLIDD